MKLFWFFLVLECLVISSCTRTVDRVVIVTRHGDRAPLQYYPAWDDNTTHSRHWPYGLGQLSKLGKRRMFLQGKFFRQRYARMFPKNFISPRDVYIQSSGVDRCLETAQVLAAAMLQPENEWIWAENIRWQPVPIKSWPPIMDPMLIASSVCPVADQIFEQIPNYDSVKNFLAPYEKLMKDMNELHKCGNDYRSMRNLFDNILTLKHHLRVEKGAGLPSTVTSWLTSSAYQELKTLFEFSFQVDYTGILDNRLRKLRSGYFLNQIFKMLDPQSTGKRLNILSTHDSAIFHLLDALGIELKETFKFGVTVLFDAYKLTDENSEIDISIINNVGDNLKAISPIKVNLHRICPIEQSQCTVTLLKMKNAYKFMLVSDYQEWLELCSGKIPA